MKIVAIGDMHCGNMLGLTPPDCMRKFELSDLMTDFWNWFVKSVPKKPDILIINGDAIDGPGFHDNSFHLTTNINEQCDMVCEIIDVIKPKKVIMTYGTAYHVGKNSDDEKYIAQKYNADISAEQRCDFNGVRFDISHTIGKTSTPTGGDIMRKKSILWSLFHDIAVGNDPAHYVLRSHIHEYGVVENSKTTAITLPALQIGNKNFNKYARRMSGGWYDVGFLEFDCKSQNEHSFKKHLFKYKVKGDEYVKY